MHWEFYLIVAATNYLQLQTHDIIEPAHDKTYNKLVPPAKTQISLCIRTVWSVFADRMCFLQPPGYPKSDKREP